MASEFESAVSPLKKQIVVEIIDTVSSDCVRCCSGFPAASALSSVDGFSAKRSQRSHGSDLSFTNTGTVHRHESSLDYHDGCTTQTFSVQKFSS